MPNYRYCDTYAEFQAVTSHVGVSTQGWLTHADSNAVLQIMKQLEPNDLFVEIGVYRGAQLLMCRLMAPEAIVIGIDPFTNDTEWVANGRHLKDCYRDDMTKAGVFDDIKIIEEPSQKVGRTWDRSIRFLLIDGDHAEQPSYLDLHLFSKWVSVGGWMAIDDMNDTSEVRRAYAHWKEEEDKTKRKWEPVYLPAAGTEDKLWVLKRTK